MTLPIDRVILCSELSGVKCEALIRNATKGALKLWIKSKVLAGTAAEVTFAPGFTESGTILYCKRDGEGFAAVITLRSSDPNQREHRANVSERCTIFELDSAQGPAMASEVINISRSGMGLLCRVPLKVGALVSVALPNSIYLGEVRHCAAEGSRFRIGLHIEHQTPRTSESHATDGSLLDRFRNWISHF